MKPQDLQDEERKQIVTYKLKVMKLTVPSSWRKTLLLPEEKVGSNITSTKAEVLVYTRILKDYDQSFFQDFENFRGTNSLEESDIRFLLEK